jgi:hypothetical protein
MYLYWKAYLNVKGLEMMVPLDALDSRICLIRLFN